MNLAWTRGARRPLAGLGIHTEDVRCDGDPGACTWEMLNDSGIQECPPLLEELMEAGSPGEAPAASPVGGPEGSKNGEDSDPCFSFFSRNALACLTLCFFVSSLFLPKASAVQCRALCSPVRQSVGHEDGAPASTVRNCSYKGEGAKPHPGQASPPAASELHPITWLCPQPASRKTFNLRNTERDKNP